MELASGAQGAAHDLANRLRLSHPVTIKAIALMD